MSGTFAIVPAAGQGTRMAGGPGATLKQFQRLAGRTILERTLEALWRSEALDGIIVAGPPGELQELQHIVSRLHFSEYVRVVAGGNERQESVWLGLQAVPQEASIVVVHDGVRPLVPPDLVRRVIAAAREAGAAIAALPVADTLKRASEATDSPAYIANTVDRSHMWAAQTPQAFQREIFVAAYETVNQQGLHVTDDASIIEATNGNVQLVLGDPRNIKITRQEDLGMVEGLLNEGRPPFRVGLGYDVHRLVPGRPLILGGVEIPHHLGLTGHSDADVLTHAVMDALLGACALGDIGRHFPDNDPAYEGASSIKLLERVCQLVAEAGYLPAQVDAVVAAEKPRLATYIPQIQQRLGAVLGLDLQDVGVKATTTEGLGFVGRQEGIEVRVVVTVRAIA